MTKQTDILEVKQYSEVFQRNITAKEIIGKVIEHLQKLTMRLGREQNEDTKLHFSTVDFWFQHTKDVNKFVIKTELRFDVHPEEWNFESILMYVEEQERLFMLQDGVNITGIDYIGSNITQR